MTFSIEGESKAEAFEVLWGGGDLRDSALAALPLASPWVDILVLLRLNNPMAKIGLRVCT